VLNLTRRMRVLAYGSPVDMRQSFNTLAALVKSLGEELLVGDFFLFVSRRRNRAKVLWFDGTGLCLLCKRMEKGLFAAIWDRVDDGRYATLTSSELLLFLEGCQLIGRMTLSPPGYVHEQDGSVFKKALRGDKATLLRH
jgi:transposase